MQALKKILLVEDEPLWQQAIQALLEAESFQIVAMVDHYQAAIAAYQQFQPDIVLLDWKIKGQPDGLAVGDALLKLGHPPEQLILISGSSPSSIPAHPFLFVPKVQISEELLPLLASVTKN